MHHKNIKPQEALDRLNKTTDPEERESLLSEQGRQFSPATDASTQLWADVFDTLSIPVFLHERKCRLLQVNLAYTAETGQVARQRGYRSTLALALYHGEIIHSSLTIYSSEVDAFDQEEIGLLTILSKVIPYAITSLREKAQHKPPKRHCSRVCTSPKTRQMAY